MKNNTKIGDVFAVMVDDMSIRFFQYVISDLTQLNSDVVRVFKRSYLINRQYSLIDIVNDEIDFYAHCVTKLGLKLKCWEYVGNINDVGKTDHILFKDSSDLGDANVLISHNWWIWYVNKEQIKIGTLTSEYKNAEIGLVINPYSLVNRIKTGDYGFIRYPS